MVCYVFFHNIFYLYVLLRSIIRMNFAFCKTLSWDKTHLWTCYTWESFWAPVKLGADFEVISVVWKLLHCVHILIIRGHAFGRILGGRNDIVPHVAIEELRMVELFLSRALKTFSNKNLVLYTVWKYAICSVETFYKYGEKTRFTL